MERPKRLCEEQEEKCKKCGLYEKVNTPFMKGRFFCKKGAKKLLLIGQNPGFQEDREGQVFVGPSGSLLKTVLKKVGLCKQYKIFATNALKCLTEEKVKLSKARLCFSFLENEIRKYEPDVIVCLGKIATQILGGKVSAVCFHTPVYPSALVYSIVHPAYCLRQGDSTRLEEGLRLLQKEKVGRVCLNYVGKKNVELFRKFLRKEGPIAIDIETSSYNYLEEGGKILSIGFSDGKEHWGVLCFHKENKELEWVQETVIPYIRKWLEKSTRKKIFHNLQFDVSWLEKKLGIAINSQFLEDTMIMYFLGVSETQPKNLKRLALYYTNLGNYDEEVEKEFVGVRGERHYEELPVVMLLQYNVLDAYATIQLYNCISSRLPQPLYRKVIEAAYFLTKVTQNGVYISLPKIRIYEEEIKQEVEEKLTKLESLAIVREAKETFSEWRHKKGLSKLNWNWNSGETLRYLLFEVLGLESEVKTETGKQSTSYKVIQGMQDNPACKLLVDLKHLWKERSLYTEKKVMEWGYKEEVGQKKNLGKLFPSYNIVGAQTGRLASSHPNMQNLPSESGLNRCFVAPPGHLIVEVDYSQNEIRCLIHYAQEPILMEALQKGEDIHDRGMRTLLGNAYVDAIPHEKRKLYRRKYKLAIFGMVYGRRVKGLAESLWEFYGFPKGGSEKYIEEASKFYNTFFSTYPSIKKWHKEVEKRLHREKKVISHFGRTRHLPAVDSPEIEISQEAIRQAKNFYTQSWSSDVTLFAAMRLQKIYAMLDKKVLIVGLIHDSVMMYAPFEEIQECIVISKYVFEHPPRPLSVLLHAGVSIGPNLKIMREIKVLYREQGIIEKYKVELEAVCEDNWGSPPQESVY